MSQRRPLMLMRPVPGPSPIHALWAGTKLLAVLAISVLLTITPSWPAIGLVALLILVTAGLAGISPGASRPFRGGSGCSWWRAVCSPSSTEAPPS